MFSAAISLFLVCCNDQRWWVPLQAWLKVQIVGRLSEGRAELQSTSFLRVISYLQPSFFKGFVRLRFPLIGGGVVKVVVKAEWASLHRYALS